MPPEALEGMVAAPGSVEADESPLERERCIPTVWSEGSAVTEPPELMARAGTSRLQRKTLGRRSCLGLPDVEEMKERVRKNLIKPAYSVEEYYHKEGLWQKIARHQVFENLTLGVIMANAIWIAVDTDWNGADTLLTAQPVFQLGEQFFCVYFSFEWFVRFMAFKRKRDGLKDGWFVFDSCLVLMMVVETWLMTFVLVIFQSGTNMGLGNVTVLRLFRLARLSRMARMLRSFPELMILLKGMMAAMRSVMLVMFLQVTIMYIFAIAFTQLADDTEMGERYFKAVGWSMYSLLIYGTFLDNLGTVCGDIRDESLACLVLFLVFIVLSALTLMNMLIGVLCEVVSAVSASEREARSVEFVTSKLDTILDNHDQNNDKSISRAEFMKLMENPEAVGALEEVGVDPSGVVNLTDFIFDDSPEDIGLKFEEFMDEILKLQGRNTATVKDIVDLRKFFVSYVDHLRHTLRQSDVHKASSFRMSLRRRRSNLTDSMSMLDVAGEPPLQKQRSKQNHEAMQSLQSRVKALEEGLHSLLGEVKKLGQRLPQVPLKGTTTQLPHLLHLEDLNNGDKWPSMPWHKMQDEHQNPSIY